MLNMDKYLKENCDLSLGERITLYSGAVLGVVAPVIYTRYVGFGDFQGDGAREALYWGGSLIASIPFSIVGGVAGLVAGMSAVLVHKVRRDGKKFEDERVNLEAKVKGLFEK